MNDVFLLGAGFSKAIAKDDADHAGAVRRA